MMMRIRKIEDHEIPYFSWDRAMTAGTMRESLSATSGFEWCRMAAWILREAAFRDVWQFLNPEEVRDNLPDLEPLLGRKKAFWTYMINIWHELGKL